jgi:hypothetical protein
MLAACGLTLQAADHLYFSRNIAQLGPCCHARRRLLPQFFAYRMGKDRLVVFCVYLIYFGAVAVEIVGIVWWYRSSYLYSCITGVQGKAENRVMAGG